MSYFFTSVSGVLPDPSVALTRRAPLVAQGVLPCKRTFLKRSSRPHVMWASATTSSESGETRALGQYTQLKGDGTSCEDTDAQRRGSDGACGVAALVTVDGATGRRVVRVSAAGPSVSAPTPSGRRITALLPCPASDASPALDGAAAALFVSDDRGNIYSLAEDARAVAEHPDGGRKRAREQVDDNGGDGSATAGAFLLRVPAHSVQSTVLASGDGGSAASSAASEVDLFAVTRGTGGWAGLAFSGAEPSQLLSAREGFADLRVIDLTREDAAAVVRTYGCTRRPTGIYVPAAWPLATDGAERSAELRPAGPLAHTVLITEGAQATLFDVRCPSAVMSLSDIFAPHVASEAVNGAVQPQDAARGTPCTAPPLVPGRFTSVNGSIADVCATANPLEVALAVDRALCVFDVRKFNRLFSAANVLKYAIGSIAATAHGRAVVCAGVSAEVRVVPLYAKDSATDTGPLTLARPGPSGAPTGGSTGAGPDEEGVAAVSSFRTRLNSSVHCASTWQGGWVTSRNMGGRVAVGISTDHEVFIAQ